MESVASSDRYSHYSSQCIIIMGVCGSGKSTISKLFASKYKFNYYDADDFHSHENKLKMTNGIILSDNDRKLWLDSLKNLITDKLDIGSNMVLACSALKQCYRDNLVPSSKESRVRFVFLDGNFETIKSRLLNRQHMVDNQSTHFLRFDNDFLQNQFNILEIPSNALKVNILKDPDSIVDEIYTHIVSKSQIGLFGLGVMGKSLARNFNRNHLTISLFNRRIEGSEEEVAFKLIQAYPEEFLDNRCKPFEDVELFVNSLQSPRVIFLSVEAGHVTDIVIQALIPFLAKGDILVDFGNSFYEDTIVRATEVFTKYSIHLLGCGISGGEEGALNGPSIMLSGDVNACKYIMPYLSVIAAKDHEGRACLTYVGSDGSGHFVKMVHNGIEYVEMQLLAELYQILQTPYFCEGKSHLSPDDIADILSHWRIEYSDATDLNETDVSSYLLDITVSILRTEDSLKSSSSHTNGKTYIIDKILDNARSKGTGNWATIESSKESIPSTMIANSVFSRFISSFKELRLTLSSLYPRTGRTSLVNESHSELLLKLKQAYTFARIINHYQGFWLISQKSGKLKWNIDLSELARIWTNGCIIRSSLMQYLHRLFAVSSCENLLEYSTIISSLQKCLPSLKSIIIACIDNDIPTPCLTDSLTFFLSITTATSTSNLIQAQRDFFGSHTFQRNDGGEESYHYDWRLIL